MEKVRIGTGIALLVCGVMFLGTVPALAQEAAHRQEGKPGKMGTCCGMMGKMQMEGKETQGMVAQMHEQTEEMRQTMLQERQKQLTALREHAKAMEGASDEQQLLAEMKKHQHMTDALLGTMVEQCEKMHGRMEAQYRQMQGQQQEQQQPAEEKKPEKPEGSHEEE